MSTDRHKLQAGKYVDEQKMQAIGRRIENLHIHNDAAFSGVTVRLIQPDQIRTSIIVDPASAGRSGYRQWGRSALKTTKLRG
ncbi:MAG: hypothetical protein P0Y53_10920 [Candidatus Pseudobacter hemicellulosilyticus]|uniref:Uncharacterized protein n=1 Tax=Candidatus Pseudobacter hemicellulosilyticus TaxID=3121375 RepID=A0AAJ5WYP3_9BACT|nr:MAG: hypothetical protein P0Y53_10920 [Pseudobacter sp.]